MHINIQHVIRVASLARMRRDTANIARKSLTVLCLFGAACRETPTHVEEDLGTPGFRVVSGANVTDTVDSRTPEPLIVELRDESGRPVPNAYIHFRARFHGDTSRSTAQAMVLCSALPGSCNLGINGGPPFGAAQTDAQGRASIRVVMGRVSGPARIIITAPELGKTDSASYVVLPGAAVALKSISADTILNIGTAANLLARVVDRYNNVRAERPVVSLSAGTALSIDAISGISSARELGTQWVVARSGTFIDSTKVRVVPPGRLLVHSPRTESVSMVNTDGTDTRRIMNFVSTSLSVVPVFGPSRQRVSFPYGYNDGCCGPNSIVTIDTAGIARRDIDPTSGIVARSSREIAGGQVLIVGTKNNTLGLWRYAPDSVVTLLAALPGFSGGVGNADISHDGTRVAYTAFLNSRAELRVFDVAANSFTVLESNASSPRWSRNDDRIAFLVPPLPNFTDPHGTPGVVNADGTGRRVFAAMTWRNGMGWSPDGNYVVGSAYPSGLELQILRISDGAYVPVTFRDPVTKVIELYQQPDWR